MKNNNSVGHGSPAADWRLRSRVAGFDGGSTLMAPVAVTIVAILASIAPFAAMSAGISTQIRSVKGSVTVSANGQPGGQKAEPGMALWDGAEVVGEMDDSSVQIECSNRATQTLIGKFDAVIDTRDAESGCAVNLREGTAVATTGPADNSAWGTASILGPISMISHHTQFGLAIEKFKSSSSAVGFVFEGAASLSRAKSQNETPVAGGSQIDPDTNKRLVIDAKVFRSVASAYADLDLSQRSPSSTSVDDDKIQERWLAVLRRPTDAQARVELVESQHEIGATKSWLFAYELNRAVTLAETSGKVDLIARAKALVPRPSCEPTGRPCPPARICIGANCASAPSS
jgi:hypothetical protein